MIRFKKTKSSINDLLTIMAALRSPQGCPWDKEQTHMTLRFHAVEEVYELIDAIETADDHEMLEELGDLLLQVIFHSQLAQERGVFHFNDVARTMADKLVRRHPHVFGNANAKTVDAVWAQWDQIKKAEKQGTRQERTSALDGVPAHLPALMRAEKLIKKARKAQLTLTPPGKAPSLAAREAEGQGEGRSLKTTDPRLTQKQVGEELYRLAEYAQSKGWSAEDLLRKELKARERAWRKREAGAR